MPRAEFPPTSLTLLGKLASPEDDREWNEAWRRFTALYGPVILARACGLPESDAEEVLSIVLIKLLNLMKTYELMRWLRVVVLGNLPDLVDALRAAPQGECGGVAWQALAGLEAGDDVAKKLLTGLTQALKETFQGGAPWRSLEGLEGAGLDRAVERFLEQADPAVARCCTKWGPSEAESAELTALVLSHLGRAVRDGRAELLPPFRHWLAVVVRNSAIDLLRELRSGSKDGDARLVQFAGDPEYDDDFASRLEAQDLLAEAEARVEPTVKNPVHWRVYWMVMREGRSGREVADSVGLTEANVHVIVGRVRSRLKKECRRLSDDETDTG